MPNNNKRLAWFSIIGDKSALLISTFLNGLVCFGGAIFKLATPSNAASGHLVPHRQAMAG